MVRIAAFALLLIGGLWGCTGEMQGAPPSTKPPVTVEPPPFLPKAFVDRTPDGDLTCDSKAIPAAEPTELGRLTNAQISRTLRDLIPSVDLGTLPDLPNEVTVEGFRNNAIGQTPSSALVDAVSDVADAVADKAMANLDRLGIPNCAPNGADAEAKCVDGFLDTFVTRAFRRPANAHERTMLIDLFASLRSENEFNESLSMLLSTVIQMPQFLYRLETGTSSDGVMTLDGYSLASRLSYLLWGTMPDETLLEEARNGELDKMAGIIKAIDRLVADPRYADGVADYTDDWLLIGGRIGSLASASSKNPATFPAYNDDTVRSLIGGLRKRVATGLTGKQGGLKNLLTSNKAWVDRNSGGIWGLDGVQSDTLVEVDLDSSQRAGLLTDAALMAGLAHEDKQSSTFRGVFVMENILCSTPPPPPPGVDATPASPEPGMTKRQSVENKQLQEMTSCRSCHLIIEGFGFAFENYDAIGRYQTTENGVPVDARTTITGTYDFDDVYDNAIDLVNAIAGSEQATQCFVEHAYRFALGRGIDGEADGCNIGALTENAIADGGSFSSLVRSIATTPAFRKRRVSLQGGI